jgi:hypothetical protein
MWWHAQHAITCVSGSTQGFAAKDTDDCTTRVPQELMCDQQPKLTSISKPAHDPAECHMRACVCVSRMPAPQAAACACSWRSRMANTRSMPMLTPTAGTSRPLNMPTRPSYLHMQHSSCRVIPLNWSE